jgi:phage recombination protein Bet
MANNELTANKSQAITYEASGQEIKLSPSIVTQFITKGDGAITEQEAINFMMLCKYAELNPYLNEAYLVKFGNKPAQMITSKEAFMKRAERQPTYKGNKAGIIVLDKNGEIIEREGTIKTKNEELLGGWARVFRSDREEPTYISINFEEFAKYKYDGSLQATWNQMPANMIRKSALVNALREAYPDQLGAMYTEDEPDVGESAPKAATNVEEDKKTQDLLSEFKEKTQKKEPENEEIPPKGADPNIEVELTDSERDELATFRKAQKEKQEQDEEQPFGNPESVEAEFEEVISNDEEVLATESEVNQQEEVSETENTDEPKEIDWSNYTVDQIKQSLDNKDVKYKSNARRDELIAVAEMTLNGGGIQDELF